MVNETSRFALSRYSYTEDWVSPSEDGTGTADPPGHNDLANHVDAHTWNATDVSADTTLDNYDFALVDASGGPVLVTLPAAAFDVNVNVKKVDSSANNVSIQTPNAETVDGLSELNISTQYASREVGANASAYFIR